MRLTTFLRFSRTSALTSFVFLVFVSAVLSSTLIRGQGSDGRPAARSVWDGVYTEAQAQRGRLAYQQHCAECHGANLQGAEYKALQGERFWRDYQEVPLDYLLGQISRNMPHSEDGSLKGTLGAGMYADIVAHILSANKFPAGSVELSRESSVGVQITRKEGPGALPAESFAHVVGCLAARGPDRNWRLLRGSTPVRVLGNQAVDTRIPLGDREYTLMFVLTPLDKYVGYRMSVQASLIGEGGAGGLNVRRIDPVSSTCE